MAAWTQAARDALITVAGCYHDFITYTQLAEVVQAQSGIRTRSMLPNWIGKVLGAVAEDCHRRGEPPLSALCVRADQTVGEGYAYVSQLAGEDPPKDLDQHAAEGRLLCYRHFGAEVPRDGGTVALPPKVAEARRRIQRSTQPGAVNRPGESGDSSP
jgi:hypothetical protein